MDLPVRTADGSHAGLPPCLPSADVAEVAARLVTAVGAFAPAMAAPAARLVEGIRPPGWALEWSLPWWLGTALGLERDAWLALTVCNLAGLGYVRLQDDLVDDDAGADRALTASPAEIPLLLTTLSSIWLREFVARFGADGRFWDRYHTWMADWVEATRLSLSPAGIPFAEYGPAQFRSLGDRGAPLKICIAGACILAGQVDRIEPIAAAVDALLAGGVLFDHLTDWQKDVARGRFNAFVAYAAGGAGGPPSPQDPRRAVIAELAGATRGRPFFDAMRGHLAAAQAQAVAAGVPGLAAFCAWLDGAAARYVAGLLERVSRGLGETTAAIVERLGPATPVG